MSTVNTESTQHGFVERQADMARNRLANTLDAIDRRRHDLLDIRGQLKQHARPLLAFAGAALFMIAGGIAWSYYQSRRRAQHVLRERGRAIKRFWSHPERMAQTGDPSAAAMVGRKLLMTAVTFLATQVARRIANPQLPAAERQAVA